MTIAADQEAHEGGEFRHAGHTLDEMCGALRQAALNEAMGLEKLEIEAARRPHRVIARTIEDVRAHGTAIGAVHAFLMALGPHKAAVAALLRGDRDAGG